jgi:hypothetical protein
MENVLILLPVAEAEKHLEEARHELRPIQRH